MTAKLPNVIDMSKRRGVYFFPGLPKTRLAEKVAKKKGIKIKKVRLVRWGPSAYWAALSPRNTDKIGGTI